MNAIHRKLFFIVLASTILVPSFISARSTHSREFQSPPGAAYPLGEISYYHRPWWDWFGRRREVMSPKQVSLQKTLCAFGSNKETN